MRVSKKNRKRSATYMLGPRLSWLFKSLLWCQKKLVPGIESNRHNMYYIFHIQYTNSEISIGLFYIRPHFVWWHRLNHCAALVRNLPASILVRASVSLLTFHTSTCPFPRCWKKLLNNIEDSHSTFKWDPKWTQTGLRFQFGVKFHFGVR